ncbi:hypothetical protein CHGG_08659 [Chaetomium globosum CBS 148.51]|uniref:SPX domain-containing protein n=1 Tax=Chaetomium globosum (strain ATCC 6205 / CBS 148.51 / DSM 1962 / NBRC 6347 / NRRL 1970) TaxID=306901 RepID=Q2GTP5_CHAGB|nr:uncharacterized protein CHGG_08659 [Chaetomium globosum CBS 148.51]EAQ84645.1 hypothetical protein CHGG_08659 [Chaetomium globosum CBS 148.51]
MKYGEQFEKESVPQWSLHNIDYNSLKHHIKVHTTRDQATAIAIPGRPNTALHKFEDDFYSELCRQHDRVELFVSSKADEIVRRLHHLSSQIHRLILRCATSGRNRMSLKRRQRFAKYEQTLHAALPAGSVGSPEPEPRLLLPRYRAALAERDNGRPRIATGHGVLDTNMSTAAKQATSIAMADDHTPPEPSYFNSPPGGTNTNTTDTDLEDDRTSSSRQASNGHSRRGSVNRGYTSSSDDQMFFPSGYSTHYAALPSVEEQRVVRYRERVLRWGTWGCYGTAFVLMGIATVLIVAGRQKMRLEVDAGVILGIMASLGLACGGLCMTSSRTDKLGLMGRLAVWSVFVVICVANGVLLVLLMGNAKI